ncbi:hypothetical protein CV102_25625 [Natronococcus pandeyae]|uniref:Uncharacterized protein n=2 Tax=Natronococcus pandeyae TaxID=2055836 RepID=A0A8J8PY95_9EURY|nr:hypothetical protein CV102_25625 [Natronococcus pandeyae]
MNQTFGVVDAFNDSEHIFRGLVGQDVDEDRFTSVAGDMKWDELAELEPSENSDLDESVMAIRVKEYGKSLAMSPAYIEDSTEQSVMQRVQKMLRGALDKENEVIFESLKAGVADGSGVWYDIPNYGNYSFDDNHSHTFADTNALFGDAEAHSATRHVRMASMDLRHHGKRPGVVICSSEFAMSFVDELAYDAGYHIPDAGGLRESDLQEATMKIDGASVVQTPYLTGNTFYVVSDEQPVYVHEKRPVTISQDSNGTPVANPADMMGAYGTARYGARLADPLAAVEVTADNLA